ncbi:MAG: GNAT family N-acetyltransferase [Polymorphobacter sp.]
MINIRPARASDLPAIDSLLDDRFGPARRNRTAYRLRDGVDPDGELSFVAYDHHRLIGSLQCWPLRLRSITGTTLPLTLLGPVVTAADRQGEGIATCLMQAALAAVDARGAGPVLLIGDEPFYGRFGFSAAATSGWLLPGTVDRARLLLRANCAMPAVGWVEPGDAVRRAA